MKQLQLFSTPETQAKSSFSEWEINQQGLEKEENDIRIRTD